MCSYRLSTFVIVIFVSSATAEATDLRHDDGHVRGTRSIFKEVNGKFGFVNLHNIPNLQPEEVYYPQGYPQIYLHWYPNGNPQGFPQWYPNGNPQGGPQGNPQGRPQGNPQGFPQWYPNGNPEGDPQGNPQGRPQGNPQGGPPEYIPDETESFDPSVGPRVENPLQRNPFEVDDLNGEDFSRSNDLDKIIDSNSL